ncbi:hypothetical protein [Aquimarina aggregata]|uniref:hypothetical protein n=1 Tax=Aquimarina aggregata TaxID=1642818 RepID=UPI0018E08341|nr:hypothetical protein [Aquimarina aggregata]
MNLHPNILDCSELQIARDIPEELSFYQEQYNELTHQNRIYKKALVLTAYGICLFIMYKTIHHYANKKKNTESACSQ